VWVVRVCVAVIVEAQKCLCNIVFNSADAQRICRSLNHFLSHSLFLLLLTTIVGVKQLAVSVCVSVCLFVCMIKPNGWNYNHQIILDQKVKCWASIGEIWRAFMNETHIRDVNKTFCLYCIDRFVHCAVCIQLYLIVIPVAYITIYQKQLVFFQKYYKINHKHTLHFNREVPNTGDQHTQSLKSKTFFLSLRCHRLSHLVSALLKMCDVDSMAAWMELFRDWKHTRILRWSMKSR